MAYIPSHQELANDPKARRCARRLGISLPTMIGHLHLLWWWSLDHADDGDLSRFEPDDLADAARWEGSAEDFLTAMKECGAGDEPGFIDPDGGLHNWAAYGGKYAAKRAAGRKAAAARWDKERAPKTGGDAAAPPPQPDGAGSSPGAESDGNATAFGSAEGGQSDGSTEERRGDKRRREIPNVDKPGSPPDLRLVAGTASASPPTEVVSRIFDRWVEGANKDRARTKLDDKRVRAIKKALKDYPLDDLLDAVVGWKCVPFNRGENEAGRTYNDLCLLLRDAEHIERFRDAARQGATNTDVNGYRER